MRRFPTGSATTERWKSRGCGSWQIDVLFIATIREPVIAGPALRPILHGLQLGRLCPGRPADGRGELSLIIAAHWVSMECVDPSQPIGAYRNEDSSRRNPCP